jgi:hypothetical protein
MSRFGQKPTRSDIELRLTKIQSLGSLMAQCLSLFATKKSLLQSQGTRRKKRRSSMGFATGRGVSTESSLYFPEDQGISVSETRSLQPLSTTTVFYT